MGGLSQRVRSKKVLVAGTGYGLHNVGDESILAGMVRALRTQEGNFHLTVLTHKPKATAQRLDIDARPLSGKLNKIREIARTNVLITGGGTILSAYPHYILPIVLWAKVLRKPVMLYAVGMDPLIFYKEQFLVKCICWLADLITVRDENTKMRLKALGIRKNFYVTADPAVLLTPVPEKRIKEIMQQNGLSQNMRSIVGMAIAYEPDSRHLVQYDLFAQLADYLIDNYGAEILFLPGNYKPDYDILAIERIESRMHNRNKVHILKKEYAPEEILGVVGELSLLVSSRLHFAIFAALRGIPFIGINRSPHVTKIDDFLKSLGQGTAGVMGEISLDNLKKKTEEVWQKREDFQACFGSLIGTMRHKALINAQMAAAFARSKGKIFPLNICW